MQEKIKIDPYLLTAIVRYLGRLPTSVQDLYPMKRLLCGESRSPLGGYLEAQGVPDFLTLERGAWEPVRQCPKLKQVYLDDAPFGDECFLVFAQLSQLTTLALLRDGQIKGHGLSLLKDLPVKTLFLQRTALDDEGLSQAAQISKLTDIYIAACPQVTFQGLMDISWRDKLVVHDMDNFDEKSRAGLFTREQKKTFEDARTYKKMKNRLSLDSPELVGPIAALQDFFKEMTHWENLAAVKGLDNPNVRAEIDQLFSRRVSWKPRPGWRPISLSFQAGGTYQGCRLTVGEKAAKNKFWLYAEEDVFYYRFLMRLVEGRWMIDNAQSCYNGKWQFCGI